MDDPCDLVKRYKLKKGYQKKNNSYLFDFKKKLYKHIFILKFFIPIFTFVIEDLFRICKQVFKMVGSRAVCIQYLKDLCFIIKFFTTVYH